MILHTTLADSSANSYNTLAGISELLYASEKEKWDVLSELEQIELAIKSTTLIDYLPYYGTKYDTSYGHQALKFPRSNHYTEDTSSGVKTPYLIPQVLKAQARQIGFMLSGFNMDELMFYRNAGVTSINLGSGVSMAFSSKSVAREDYLCTEAQLELKPFLAMKVLRIDRG